MLNYYSKQYGRIKMQNETNEKVDVSGQKLTIYFYRPDNVGQDEKTPVVYYCHGNRCLSEFSLKQYAANEWIALALFLQFEV